MFYYISFLRPPPLQSTTYGNIQITPQISNDLRTELFDGSADIFYSWSQTGGFSSTTAGHNIFTKPNKLTTWRQATAYKEIPVPLPPGARDGQSWRLVLGTRLTAGRDGFSVIGLHNKDVGQDLFPVMSMPIQFGSRVSKSPKQEQIERMYRLRPMVGEGAGVVLKLTEQTSFDLDKKVWDSGIGLSSWLVGLEQSIDAEDLVLKLKNVIFSRHSRNVLELGKNLSAGIGIVGLTLAALRSTRPLNEGAQDRIIATDLESAIPLIEHNIAANASHLRNTRLEAAVLDWDDDALPEILTNTVLTLSMADVTYNTASFPSLVRTLSNLMKIGKVPPLVLLGYKERDSTERSLWDLASDFGLSLQRAGISAGGGGTPVEIWLGQMTEIS
ncbi:UPF0665 family protein C23C4.06c [Termitomyces sp. J132]|nr:UPF0665 family protein C23C4.06c [Termitomyces sp. J132]